MTVQSDFPWRPSSSVAHSDYHSLLWRHPCCTLCEACICCPVQEAKTMTNIWRSRVLCLNGSTPPSLEWRRLSIWCGNQRMPRHCLSCSQNTDVSVAHDSDKSIIRHRAWSKNLWMIIIINDGVFGQDSNYVDDSSKWMTSVRHVQNMSALPLIRCPSSDAGALASVQAEDAEVLSRSTPSTVPAARPKRASRVRRNTFTSVS